SLSQASRYYEFILIVANRHNEVSQKMILNHTKLMDLTSVNGNGVMSEEQVRIYNDGIHLTTLVHLEIESFYLFAKTLLDKLALFLQNYFGQARGISLISHDKLTKGYVEYGTAKGLTYPNGFSESLLFLKEHVCDYRDKQISHLQNPRSIKGTLFNASGQTRIVNTPLFPNQNELGMQVESKTLPELLHAIDTHIQLIILTVRENRDKTRYKTNGTET
ncbi:MAG: hypothetical protein L6Q29_05300, partial [Candidatus Pacebacteria bacterium]|nr:hypothetical protein [Candidatus Paceibacterota bacterium]